MHSDLQISEDCGSANVNREQVQDAVSDNQRQSGCVILSGKGEGNKMKQKQAWLLSTTTCVQLPLVSVRVQSKKQNLGDT